MAEYPLSGLRVRLAMTVAGSFALLLALSAVVLYAVLRREWRAEVDRGLHQSVEAAQRLFSSDLPDYGSTEAAIVHIMSELVFGDRAVVALSPTGRHLAKSRPIAGLPDISSAALDGVGSRPTTLPAAGGPVRAISVPLRDDYSLVIAFALAPLEERLANLRWNLGLGFVMCLIVGTGVAMLASRRALEPITTMAVLADRVSDSVAQGTIPHPAIPEGIRGDEVGRLQKAFSLLISRLDSALAKERDAATHQRRFFADAAHELRTPVAILQNELGIALSGPAAALNRETLSRLATEVRQLSQLVGDLLLLARGETAADVGAQSVFLDDVASKAVLRVGRHPAAANRRIGIGQFDAARVRGDATLLERAIVALIENALLHAAPSDVEVAVGVVPGGGAWVSVADHGEAIPDEATGRIFDRFVRLRHDTPGSGLGLAIVRWIAELHGGTLTLTQHPSPATKAFTIRLPAVLKPTGDAIGRPGGRPSKCCHCP